MGSALHVPLPHTRAGETVLVKITYETTEQCPALMWLEKECVDYWYNHAYRATADRRWLDLQTDGRQEVPISVQSMSTDPCAQSGALAR